MKKILFLVGLSCLGLHNSAKAADNDTVSVYVFVQSLTEFEWDSASVLLNLDTGAAGALPSDFASLNWSYTYTAPTAGTGKLNVSLEAAADAEFNSCPLNFTTAAPTAGGTPLTVDLVDTGTTGGVCLSAMPSGSQAGVAGTISVEPTTPGQVPDEKDYYFFMVGLLSDT